MIDAARALVDSIATRPWFRCEALTPLESALAALGEPTKQEICEITPTRMTMDKVNKLPSLIEAQNDINLTSYDLVWLSKVENAISMLINHSQVENKDYYGGAFCELRKRTLHKVSD